MADLYTADAVMDFWDSHATAEQKAERDEIESIRKDVDTARKYINDALARYRKDKTKSRSKAKAANPFADLADYSSKEDIHNAFGWGMISEAEMDRLWKLWDLREESKSKTSLEDRVTEMLELAIRAAGKQYTEKILDYDARRSKMRREAERVARENLMRG